MILFPYVSSYLNPNRPQSLPWSHHSFTDMWRSHCFSFLCPLKGDCILQSAAHQTSRIFHHFISFIPNNLLPSPGSPHNRPINQVVGIRNSDFIQKASRPRRWWTSILKEPSCPPQSSGFFYTCRVVGCGELLAAWIFCTCSCSSRSGHKVPVSLQDNCYFLLRNFLNWKVLCF